MPERVASQNYSGALSSRSTSRPVGGPAWFRSRIRGFAPVQKQAWSLVGGFRCARRGACRARDLVCRCAREPARMNKEGTSASAVGERLLSYGLTVQKMRDGRPYQDTFESSGQEIFENGWKFRMNITSPQEGYLYLLNEGPAAGGATTYNMLFPEPKTNGGSPRVTANQNIETAWMVFDEHQGTEKFWIVWAAQAVPELGKRSRE